jgi:transketolase
MFNRLPLARQRPTCVIAHTMKGRGVSFIQDRVDWHHRIPTAAELAEALAELEDQP